MASGDSLREILDMARRELPDVPADVWSRLEGLIRNNFGTERIYIAAQRKRQKLDALAQADQAAGVDALAQMLGVSVRHARRLKRGR